MIYPQKLSSKNGEKVFRILLSTSIILGIILILINKLTTPQIHWAELANCGIIYTWITVIYCINKRTNVAGHVFIQSFIISAVLLYIDDRIGFRGWSISMGIPIVVIAANTTMFILTIITYKNYIKYGMYQLLIVLASFITMGVIWNKIENLKVLSYIAMSISVFSFVISLSLCFKDVKESVIRKLHM